MARCHSCRRALWPLPQLEVRSRNFDLHGEVRTGLASGGPQLGAVPLRHAARLSPRPLHPLGGRLGLFTRFGLVIAGLAGRLPRRCCARQGPMARAEDAAAGGGRMFALCRPYCTAMGWPSRAGPRAGPSPLRERAPPPPPPGDPCARPAVSKPGPAGPVRPRRSTSRASWARAGLFGSCGRRGLQTHRARTSPPSQQPDRPGLGSPRHVADSPGGARGPSGRCAAVTWRCSGPASDPAPLGSR